METLQFLKFPQKKKHCKSSLKLKIIFNYYEGTVRKMKNFFGTWKNGIIFAADLPSSEENFRVLDEIHEDIDVIKLSGFLALKESVLCIRKFKDRYNKPVFADFKVADVPHTNEKIVAMVK